MESIHALSFMLEERLKLALQKIHEATEIIGTGMNGTAEVPSTSLMETLTPTERKIFDLIGQDLGTKDIIQKLEIAPKTYYVHRSNLKRKLHLKSTKDIPKFYKAINTTHT